MYQTLFVSREELKTCREKLALERKRLGEPPYFGENLSAWNTYVENFQLSMETVNEKIHKFNLVVPMLHRQLMPYNSVKELEKVCENYQDYVPEDYERIIKFREESQRHTSDYTSLHIEPVRLRDVWKEVKGLFRKGENA